jgi:hypothetical protein
LARLVSSHAAEQIRGLLFAGIDDVPGLLGLHPHDIASRIVGPSGVDFGTA